MHDGPLLYGPKFLYTTTIVWRTHFPYMITIALWTWLPLHDYLGFTDMIFFAWTLLDYMIDLEVCTWYDFYDWPKHRDVIWLTCLTVIIGRDRTDMLDKELWTDMSYMIDIDIWTWMNYMIDRMYMTWLTGTKGQDKTNRKDISKKGHDINKRTWYKLYEMWSCLIGCGSLWAYMMMLILFTKLWLTPTVYFLL